MEAVSGGGSEWRGQRRRAFEPVLPMLMISLMIGEITSLPSGFTAPAGSSHIEFDDGDDEDGPRVPIPPSLHAAMSSKDRSRLRVGGWAASGLAVHPIRSIDPSSYTACIRP